uniref:Uncharacterized protein n=1 Tax=Cyprinodon variegatus TaxID=28743 RepID=A0A3Q2DWX1_CYPVA
SYPGGSGSLFDDEAMLDFCFSVCSIASKWLLRRFLCSMEGKMSAKWNHNRPVALTAAKRWFTDKNLMESESNQTATLEKIHFFLTVN